MPGRGDYQSLDIERDVVHGVNRHRTRTSVACSQVFALLHIVVGLVLPLAYAFQTFQKKNLHSKNLEFWQLDAYTIYLYGLSIICILAMIAFGMLKTHDGKQSHQFASEFIKFGAALFGVCGMLQAGFKFGSILHDHNCENCDNHRESIGATESLLTMLFILILFLFVCAYSNRCITKWKRCARVALMVLWATCMGSWSGLFVDEVMYDIEHSEFNYGTCMQKISPILQLTNFQYIVNRNRNNVSVGNETFDTLQHDAAPFLTPGAMEFYLIMSGFMYVMYGNIEREIRITRLYVERDTSPWTKVTSEWD